MAKDSIQTKYLEGEGSPEGVVKGKVGFTYKDLLTEDEYISLGGSNWRIIKTEDTSLTPIIVDSNIDLGELELVRNDKVINTDNGVSYTYIKKETEEERRYIHFAENATTDSFKSNPLTKLYEIGSKGSITLVMNSMSPLPVNIFTYETSKCRIRLNRINDLYYTVSATHSLDVLPIFNVWDVEGNPIDISKLQYGVKYIIEWTQQAETNVTLDRGLYLNPYKNNDVHIFKLTIEDEVFDFSEGIGDRVNGTKGGYFENIEPDSTVWGESSELDSKTGLIYYKNNIFKINTIDSIIKPEHFGHNNKLNNNLEFINDVSDVLEKCINSGNIVYIPAGNYYITRTIRVPKNTTIIMEGNRIDPLIYEGNIQDTVAYYKDNIDTTVIYSDKNIDFFSIEGSKVTIKNGVVLTALVDQHTRAAYKINMNYDIWGLYLDDINVFGDKGDLSKKIGNGTLGIYVNCDEVSPEEGEVGFLTMYRITGVIHYCAKAFYHPLGNDEYNSWGYYSNSGDVYLYTKHCKTHFDVHGTSGNFEGDIQAGSAYILAPGETALYHNFNINSSYINVNAIDSDIPNPFAISSGFYNTYGPKVISRYQTGGFRIDNYGTHQTLDDPRSFNFIDKGSETFISELHNPLRFIGTKGAVVTEKVFEAPNLEWFSSNLYSADSIQNDLPLTEDTSIDKTEITTFRGATPFTTAWDAYKYTTANKVQNKKDLGFYELTISSIPIKYEISGSSLFVQIDRDYADSLQMIIIFQNGTKIEKTFSGRLPLKTLRLDTPSTNSLISDIIIRCIGKGSTQGTPSLGFRITDVALVPRYFNNKNIIHVGGGQTIHGGLTLLGEFEPESIKGTTPITTTNTETTIQLITTGGNFCNMGNASTVKTFTTTGNVLGAWAEVLVNRVDQPSITGATYKPDKGVPFVPSTDMIMRVENKGVPRGVQYWFEEI